MLLNKLRTPKFWYKKQSILSKCLNPIARLIKYISNIKYNSVSPEKLLVPVIGIDSIVMSGAGKTPAIDYVCNILKQYKYNPHILTANHSGYIKNVVQVNPKLHSYLQVGDEPLLYSQLVNTWIGKNRIKASNAALNTGANVLVIDDYLKNNYLQSNYKLLVIDSEQMFCNECLFPAGPLMHKIESSINKSDAVLIIGNYNETLENNIKLINDKIQIFRAKMEVVNKLELDNHKVIAFCGLGYPNKFKNTLKKLNYNVIDFWAFSDHHPYTITEIRKLLNIAQNNKAILVTTMKDYVKIPEVFKKDIQTIQIKLVLENEEFTKDLIKSISENK